MDGMNIVAGDLESLAQSSACVAEDIVAKKVEAAFGDASSAMPGSESSKLISETGDSVDKRIKELSDRYTDFTEKVKASLHEYFLQTIPDMANHTTKTSAAKSNSKQRRKPVLN